MPKSLEALFTPAEFAALPSSDLSNATCVVFDIFRATSTIVTALANGANSVIPVSEISEALEIRKIHPDYLLAGEREGRRIRAAQAGGADFDLGNSPREFKSETVLGRNIVMTTTNGSRALRACAGASRIYAASFLNLASTAQAVRKTFQQRIILVCSGTGQQTAYEDILAAGALAQLLCAAFFVDSVGDSVNVALRVYEKHSADILGSVQNSQNGRRLLSIPELSGDVPFCLQRDVFNLVAEMRNGRIEKATAHS